MHSECAIWQIPLRNETCEHGASAGVVRTGLCTFGGLDCWPQIILFSHGYLISLQILRIKILSPSFFPIVISSCAFTLFSCPRPLSCPFQCSLRGSFQSVQSGLGPERVPRQRVATWLKSFLCTRSQHVPQAHGRGGHSLYSSRMHLYQVFFASGRCVGSRIHQVEHVCVSATFWQANP